MSRLENEHLHKHEFDCEQDREHESWHTHRHDYGHDDLSQAHDLLGDSILSHEQNCDTHEEGCACEECRTHAGKENFRVSGRLHEGASVISGECFLHADYGKVSAVLKASLEELASLIAGKGGLIGHIKAAAEIRSVEMFSVTDAAVSVKRSDGQEIAVRIAAIIFFVELDEAIQLVKACVTDKLREF